MKNMIYVNYLSRFANNIFQYALAHIIRDLVDGEIFFSPDCIIRIGESHDRPAEKVPIQDIPLYRITDSKNILARPEWSGKFREDEKAALRKPDVLRTTPVSALPADGRSAEAPRRPRPRLSRLNTRIKAVICR